MRISHISDSHGRTNNLSGHFDIVIHSGDFMPDNNYHKLLKEGINQDDKDFQIQWLHQNAKKIRDMIQKKPFFFTLGNHDFVEGDVVEEILRNHDIEATCLNDKIVTYQDYTMYGFPYIPYICGDWAYERRTDTMRTEVSALVKAIKGRQIDMLVAHCPPYGILDQTKSGEHIGNRLLTDYLDYKLDRIDQPKWVLCGHAHYSSGIACEYTYFVSNAACIQNNIEIH